MCSDQKKKNDVIKQHDSDNDILDHEKTNTEENVEDHSNAIYAPESVDARSLSQIVSGEKDIDCIYCIVILYRIV
jgi:hypothetical protein